MEDKLLKNKSKKKSKKLNKSFFKEMKPLNSFENIDAVKYVQELRGKSRII